MKTFAAAIFGICMFLALAFAPDQVVTGPYPPTPLSSGATGSVLSPASFFVCTTTCTVAVPLPRAGSQFCVWNGDNVATVITLSALGGSAQYENTARTSYGTAGTGTFASGGAAKDFVCMIGVDSTHYNTLNSNGTWTAS